MDSGEASSPNSLRSPTRAACGGISCRRAESPTPVPRPNIDMIRIIRIVGKRGSPFLSVLMRIIEDVGLGPFLSPPGDPESSLPAPGRRADDPVEAGVDDHLLADETGKGIDRLVLSIDGPVDVHVAPEEAHPCPGGVDDGVLFGVDAAAEFVAFPVGDAEPVAEAKAVLLAALRLARGADAAGRDDLVVPDDDGADGPPEAGGTAGPLLGDPPIKAGPGDAVGRH